MRVIRSKRQMYQALHAGAFGNAPEQWEDVGSFLADGPHGDGLFGIRSLCVGGRCLYDVPAHDVPRCCAGWNGAFNISPMQPDDRLIIQGEVARCPDLYLFFSNARKPMRQALAESGRSLHGLAAQMLMRQCLNPSSYEDVMCLLDLYPDHAVEFGAYSVGVGIDPTRNHIIWEVRQY